MGAAHGDHGGDLEAEVHEGSWDEPAPTSHLRSREEYIREVRTAMERWLPGVPLPPDLRSPASTSDLASKTSEAASNISGSKSVGDCGQEAEEPQDRGHPEPRTDEHCTRSDRCQPCTLSLAMGMPSASATSSSRCARSADSPNVGSREPQAHRKVLSRGSNPATTSPLCLLCSDSPTPLATASCSGSPRPKWRHSIRRPSRSTTSRSSACWCVIPQTVSHASACCESHPRGPVHARAVARARSRR